MHGDFIAANRRKWTLQVKIFQMLVACVNFSKNLLLFWNGRSGCPFFVSNHQPDAAQEPILGLDGVTWPLNHQSNHMFNISRHGSHNFVEINWNQVQFMEFKSKFLQNNSSHQVTVNAIYWRRAELNTINRADVPHPWNVRGRDIPSSRIWTSDLWISIVVTYSTPLYQLSYRRIWDCTTIYYN